MKTREDLVLFGGEEGWKASDWTASDDRVRGGKSQSYLDVSSKARFYGTLDIKTLGGAGFASQRTTSEVQTWDLSPYDGIQLNLGKSDGKRYTFIIKDKLLPKNPENGREQATISYEYDFNVSKEGAGALAESSTLFVKWDDLTPTYRGKEKMDAPKLDRKNVKRFSIMMRSFFGDQEGDFSLTIKSIKAVSLPDDPEKGSMSENDQARNMGGQRRRLFTKSVINKLLGFSLTTCAICVVVCYLVKGSHSMWSWH